MGPTSDSSSSETEREQRLDVVRVGAKPFTFTELLNIAEKPWHFGLNDLTIALHWTWNQMHDARKRARALLRTSTGHIGQEERVRDKSNQVYQKPGERLQSWQEERSSGETPDFLRLGLYTRFAAEIEDFHLPITTKNGVLTVDVEKMLETERIDPADGVSVVACATYDMKMSYLKRILHHEMDYMKDHPLARDPMTEDDISWQLRWKGEKPDEEVDKAMPTPPRKKRSAKHTLPEGRRIGLYLGDAPDPDATFHVIPTASKLLRRGLSEYAPKEGFPYHDISSNKLWDEVKKMPVEFSAEPWKEGWLKYEVKQRETGEDGKSRAVRKVWNVTKGEELGAVLQKHEEFSRGVENAPFCLEFLKGMLES